MHKILENKAGEVKIEIEVPKETLNKIAKIVVEDLGKQVKIAGFRPGKAPMNLVEKEVGKDAFWAEVTDKAIPEAYFEAVVAEKLATISQPQIQITKFVPAEQLVFEATVAIIPEIKDFKYKDLKIKEKAEKISVKDKSDALDGLLKRYTEEQEVERAAKKDDKVEIDFEGTIKGLPFDGGTSKNHPLILGSGMMIEGFEDKIIGHKAGDEFDFDITFPKDYHAGNLAGQKTNFKIKIHKVYEMVVPKASDEWAKKIGFESLAKLQEELEKQLDFEKGLEQRRLTEEEILGKIIEANKIEAPGVLVSEETHRMIHEAEHNLSHSGLTMDQFLEMSKKTLQELEEEMKPEAERRVKIGIVLGEVARIEEVKIEEGDIDAEIDKIVATAPEGMPKEDVKAAYETPDRQKDISNNLIIRKTMDRLWELNVAK
jgi:trigger factor